MPESVNKEYRLHSMRQGVFPFMDMDEDTARMHEAEAEQQMLDDAQSFYDEWLSKSPEEIEAFVKTLRAYQLGMYERFLPRKRKLLDAVLATFSFASDTSETQQCMSDDYDGFAEDAKNLSMDGRQVATTFAIAVLSHEAHSKKQ